MRELLRETCAAVEELLEAAAAVTRGFGVWFTNVSVLTPAPDVFALEGYFSGSLNAIRPYPNELRA
jgi:hypothetical protein